MTVVQLAVMDKKENQEAWGDSVATAHAVVGYMNKNAVGLVNAKTGEQIENGAMAWAMGNGLHDHGLGARQPKKAEVPGVLHKLVQGVSHAALRMVNLSTRFYMHVDSEERLREEGVEADKVCGQAVAPKLLHKPCVTCGCPYTGLWDPPVPTEAPARSGKKHEVVFPEGPKCCGCCTGLILSGRSMGAAHGKSCERVPWFGLPAINTADTAWLTIVCMSALNEAFQKAQGAARFGEKELQARVTGVTVEWSFSAVQNPRDDNAIAHLCEIVVTKSDGLGQWKVQMAGNSRKNARLRAMMAFLHCYMVTLEIAAKRLPVNYLDIWDESLNALHAKDPNWPPPMMLDCRTDLKVVAYESEAGTFGAVVEPGTESDDDSECSGDGDGAVASAAAPQIGESAAIAQLSSSVGTFTSLTPAEAIANPWAPMLEPAQEAASAAAESDIWGDHPTVATPVPLKVTRSMCAVARHDVEVYALPIQQTNPGVKIVPVSELRAALWQDKRTRNTDFSVYADGELLDAFVAESNDADTKSHGGVQRFARTTLDTSAMRPADLHSRSSLQNRGEPCLVVRNRRG